MEKIDRHYNKTQCIHSVLISEFNKKITEQYFCFDKCKNINLEEGLFASLINKNNKNDKRVVGLVPTKSDSIYTNNEIYKFVDLTNDKSNIVDDLLGK